MDELAGDCPMNRYRRTWCGSLAILAIACALGALGTAHESPEKSNRNTSDPQLPSPSQTKHFRELTGQIDAAIDAKLQEEKIPASGQAEDAEFLRRVYLDLTGVIPTAEKAKAFLDSKDRDRRARLIDELLASSEYA